VLCGCLRILLRCCHCCCHVGRLARLRRLITTVKWTRAACCQFVPVPCSIVTTSPASAALDLTDVHAKLDRAEEHINDLSDEIDSFVNGESYGSFEARLNPIDESYSMIFRENKPLPVSRLGRSSRRRVSQLALRAELSPLRPGPTRSSALPASVPDL